jgi:hypothetical protein
MSYRTRRVQATVIDGALWLTVLLAGAEACTMLQGCLATQEHVERRIEAEREARVRADEAVSVEVASTVIDPSTAQTLPYRARQASEKARPEPFEPGKSGDPLGSILIALAGGGIPAALVYWLRSLSRKREIGATDAWVAEVEQRVEKMEKKASP